MHNLACCYRHGEGVEQNMTEAIRWYTAAAEGGNADDMYELGWQYDHGEGVEQDMKRQFVGTNERRKQEPPGRHE